MAFPSCVPRTHARDSTSAAADDTRDGAREAAAERAVERLHNDGRGADPGDLSSWISSGGSYSPPARVQPSLAQSIMVIAVEFGQPT